MEKVKDFLIGEDVIVEPRNILEELKKFFDWELAYRLAFYHRGKKILYKLTRGPERAFFASERLSQSDKTTQQGKPQL